MVLIIIALILASSFFSLFRQALQSVRIPRIKKEISDAENHTHPGKAEKYRRIQQAAENPGVYYAAGRVWVCVLRTIAAILGALSAGHVIPCPLPVVAAALVCAFLVLGDLIPGIIARNAPERIAAGIFPLFWAFTQPLRPLLYLVQIIGERMYRETGMTEDELRHALIEGEKSGIVESKERTMVEGVFYLGDRPLGAFMTHRSEIHWLDINVPVQEILPKVLEHRTQRCFPVADSTLDAIIGAVYSEDVILDYSSGRPAGLRTIMKKALFVPQTMPALNAFESFRHGEVYFLFVMDEYGGFAGMVSLRALMQEIVGDFAAPVREEERAVLQEDGSWLTGGALHIDDAAALLSLSGLSASSDYHTLAGFLLSLAGELPRAGDSFEYQGYRFTVLDMDGNRIGKIEIRKAGSKE